MQQSPGAPVVTPEAVPLEFETAGLGSRFLGLTVDWLIQGAVLVVFVLILVAVGDDGDLPTVAAIVVVTVAVFAVLWAYPVLFETFRRGRTPGKAAAGLRVVTVEGAPVGFRHAAIRATLGLVDFYLTSGAAAVLSVLLTRDNRRLGDLAAGTIVLRERRAVRAPEAVSFVVPPALQEYAAVLDVSGLSPQEYAAVRSFLLRAPSLSVTVRSDLARQFADPLLARLQPPPPVGTLPEDYLQCVAAAYQARGRAGGPPVA